MYASLRVITIVNWPLVWAASLVSQVFHVSAGFVSLRSFAEIQLSFSVS